MKLVCIMVKSNLHLVLIGGENESVCPEQRKSIFSLGRAGAEDGDGQPESLAELDGHVAEAAEADHPERLSRVAVHVVSLHRRVDRDSGTQQRCRRRHRVPFRYPKAISAQTKHVLTNKSQQTNNTTTYPLFGSKSCYS